MRKFNLLFIFLLFASLGFSQSDRVSEKKEMMKIGSFNALVVNLPNADDKVALKVWKTFIKAYGSKAKKPRRSKEFLSKDVIIAGINNAEPMEVYAKANDKSDGSELLVWFSMGEFFVSSAAFPSDYVEAQKFLNEYAHEVDKELVRMELDAAEKKFGKMEKQMKKLKKKNDGYHKDIEKAKNAIAKAEKNIEENVEQQKNQEGVMTEQQKVIDAIKEKLSGMQ